MAYSLSISITQNSQSVANNTSNVTVKVNCSWTYGTWSAENLTKYCTINGTKYDFSSTDINPSQTTSGSSTLYTKTLDIAHNADGTGKVDVYAYTSTTTSSGNQSASASKTLTTIARKSTVSATNEYIEDNCLITISRKSSSFTHTLKYTFGSLSGTIATKTSSTSVNFSLPHAFYAQLGSTGTSKSGTITCETFSGSTSLGSNSCTFTAYANPQNCQPYFPNAKVTIDTTSQNLTGSAKKAIRGYTDVSVVIGGAALNSATLSKQSVKNGGKTLTANGSFTDITDGVFEFSATDSRGYTGTYKETLTMVPYVKLTANLDVRIGVDGTADITIRGNYFNESFGAVANYITPQYRYKYPGGEWSSWMYVNPEFDGDRYTAAGEDWGFDYGSVYIFQARATDALGTVTTKEIEVTGKPIFDWGENDFNFNVPPYYKGIKMAYAPGDVVTFTDATAFWAGMITNSGTDLLLTIPINKPICANSYELSGKLMCRGINAYINGSSYADSTAVDLQGSSTYKIESKNINSSGLSIQFRFTGAIPNATNNTPIIVTPYGEVTITFN